MYCRASCKYAKENRFHSIVFAEGFIIGFFIFVLVLGLGGPTGLAANPARGERQRKIEENFFVAPFNLGLCLLTAFFFLLLLYQISLPGWLILYFPFQTKGLANFIMRGYRSLLHW